MFKNINEYNVRSMESLAILMQRWTQHSKEASGRSLHDLLDYDIKWNELIDFILETKQYLDMKNSEDYQKRDYVLSDFVDCISYKGPLFRIHRKFNKRNQSMGVDFNGHWVSWSKATDATELYIFSTDKELLKINAIADDEQLGIDMNRFFELFAKYSNGEDPWFLGPPSIIEEQEVIFPLKRNLVTSMEITNK